MHLPQIIYGCLLLLGIGSALAKDGELKTGRHSFFATLVASAMVAGLLHWGGFW